MNAVSFITAEGAAVVNELPMPAIVFGLIAIVAFIALAVVTFSFRDVANRHAEKAEQYKQKFGGQAPHHR
ncbi:hypothetical protein [Canibacter zhoujuaniae]|uniref:hypothetical protein n=1 Tax=Canibacter zhoujuaniae TaxID=2708343 RepID=UPI00141ECFCA|nr:hypothetical protein [Canibacter zhoujuaniae]